MVRILKVAVVTGAAVGLVACGSTSFNTTWTAPDAGPLSLEAGTKVIGMVVTSNAAKRRGFEAALVSELNDHGLDGVAACEHERLHYLHPRDPRLVEVDGGVVDADPPLPLGDEDPRLRVLPLSCNQQLFFLR